MVVIETKDVTYTYPGATKPSIKNVSITINKGDFVILTGPSGCGKTTLCRCFNGLVPHFYNGKLEGTITVADLNVADHKIYQLALHVGLVFQNPENQLFALSVEKDVAFGLENFAMPRDEMRKRVDWALQIAGISELSERPPHELSGGQQQRVAIASVLAMQPDIMILDEPTSFLDPVGAEKIFEVLNELNKKLGITIILVEHRLDLAAKYANHVIVMNEGKVALTGTPREIFTSEKARLIGIGIPKATKLYQHLKQNGVELKAVPVTPEEAANLLREVLKRA
ncbi:ATP-binding cassette domain-containing protein [Candidatus Bathyarchaeota archaeon]|nr:ATP-binding cassette domain-containing protein [Candidatus Bathyarchaeota archaeon]